MPTNYRNFETISLAFAFMLRHKGEYNDMRLQTVVSDGKWKCRVIWN